MNMDRQWLYILVLYTEHLDLRNNSECFLNPFPDVM